MPGHPIEIILLRELADHLSTAIFVVDPDGALVFYNEPAEYLLGRRYDETGPLALEEWSTMFTADQRTRRIPAGREAAARDLARRATSGAGSHLDPRARRRPAAPRDRGDTVDGAVGRQARRGRDLLGAAVRVTMWGTRGSQATPGNETVRYGGNTSCVEVRVDSRQHHRARRRHRASAGSASPSVPRSFGSTCCSPTSTWTTSRASGSSTCCTAPVSKSTSGARARPPSTCGPASCATCRRRSFRSA